MNENALSEKTGKASHKVLHLTGRIQNKQTYRGKHNSVVVWRTTGGMLLNSEGDKNAPKAKNDE